MSSASGSPLSSARRCCAWSVPARATTRPQPAAILDRPMRPNLTCRAPSASCDLPGPAVPPPDHLDGLFRTLVENLTALDPGAVHRPVRMAEIADRIIPYKTHRAMLGFDTNEDY